MGNFAPIAIFVYRRFDLIDSFLDNLELCSGFNHSEIFIYSDGAKDAASEQDVERVRYSVKSRLRSNMRLVEAQENCGLAASIMTGVTELCSKYGRAIVLEDDLVFSKNILEWFNSSLDAYENEASVMQISGHVFGRPAGASGHVGFFAPITTSWGWATWARAWKEFDPEAAGSAELHSDRRLRRKFDFNGAYPFFRMLQRQQRGEISSWAIRWYWSVFRAKGVVLYPPQTLVINIGNDERATHPGLRNRIRKLVGASSAPQTLMDASPLLPAAVSLIPSAVEGLRNEIKASRSIFPIFSRRNLVDPSIKQH
jgi:hypothetical protein